MCVLIIFRLLSWLILAQKILITLRRHSMGFPVVHTGYPHPHPRERQLTLVTCQCVANSFGGKEKRKEGTEVQHTGRQTHWNITPSFAFISTVGVTEGHRYLVSAYAIFGLSFMLIFFLIVKCKQMLRKGTHRSQSDALCNVVYVFEAITTT